MGSSCGLKFVGAACGRAAGEDQRSSWLASRDCTARGGVRMGAAGASGAAMKAAARIALPTIKSSSAHDARSFRRATCRAVISDSAEPDEPESPVSLLDSRWWPRFIFIKRSRSRRGAAASARSSASRSRETGSASASCMAISMRWTRSAGTREPGHHNENAQVSSHSWLFPNQRDI